MINTHSEKHMSTYTRHPLSAQFRDLNETEYRALKDALAKDGQDEPIKTLNGTILDGWHRYQACMDVGLTPIFKEYHGSDPEGYVNRKNAGRRHESEEDREARIRKGKADGKSNRQIAAEVGCSDGTVRNVLNSGAQNYAPETPAYVTGKDGKKYPAKREPRAGIERLTDKLPERPPANIETITPAPDPQQKTVYFNPTYSRTILKLFRDLDLLIALEQKRSFPIRLIKTKDLADINQILPRILAFLQEQSDDTLFDPYTAHSRNHGTIPVPGSADIH